ncbi:uncharacterized protein LOC120924279 isoform X2 [Rana temporaria]|uniref:uncharacterized protein LOC120924279 isoform X2 n=1 Tax=Rana temporaria TaxID=8407 RepID=UPI001AACEBDF|nr:uncharacterized protein LOC120924279 isoform X2 [Rana temporaria]XP_040191090.1 uncharacterized protein LOC120924279 isoform X2 [Rana temporaria]
MAVPSTSHDPENMELRNSFSSKNSPVHFVEGRHLSITDVYNSLTKKSTELNTSGKKMLETLKYMEPHRFEHIQQEFGVRRLQHVTDKSSMDGIYDEERFKAKMRASRPEFRDLLFWSADIAQKDIREARKESYEKAKKVLPSGMAKKSERKIKSQFANSPAFDKSASRYGNFKFSLPLSDLLSLYRTQHCGGEKPQLRILGTDLYKQEITHYILVHSPDQSHQFMNLSNVQHGFIYLKDEKVYWSPESTSISLKVKIAKDPGPNTCHPPCKFYKEKGYCMHQKIKKYEIPSVWNHLVFAFHLSNNNGLNIQKDKLLKSLKACDITDSALLDKDKQLKVEDTKNIIQKMKCDAKSSDVPKGPVKNKRTKDSSRQSEPPQPSGDTTTGPGPVKKKCTEDPSHQSESPLPSGDTTSGSGPAKTRRTQDQPPPRAYFR